MLKNATLPFSESAWIQEAHHKPKVVHFIGIGGIGTSALAQWFLAQKWAVFGSDISSNETTQSLRKLGIKVKFGHKKGNIPQGCALIICTQAIRPENAELKEANRRKIPVLSYPEAIGKLTQFYRTIAIAGAHGKSTTTAIVSMILLKAGFDPTVIIGTKLKEFGGRNFWNGKSSYLVLEADEYGGAFLNYSPLFTVVTNIDREHLDFYKNLNNIKKSYLEFFSRTENGGALILNQDSKILFSLKSAIKKIAKKKYLKVHWYSLGNPESKKIRKIIRIAGEHNVSNALAAFYLSRVLKILEKTALRAIGNYRGSWRRMEYRGESLISHVSCLVYDDYAHHPTEIEATLQAFREKFLRPETGRGSPRGSGAAKPPYLICVFQPHQAERLKLLFKDFQSAFADADITLILPMYQVAGRDIVHSSFTSEKLVKAIQKKYPKKLVFYLSNPDNLKKALNALMLPSPHPRKSAFSQRKSAIVVMMGAGDIVKYTYSLLSS